MFFKTLRALTRQRIRGLLSGWRVSLPVLFVLFCLNGCSRRPAGSDLSEISVWELEDAQVAPYIDSVFSAFEALPENKGIKILRTHYQVEDLRQQFQAASLAGVAPDLIMCPSDAAGLFAVSGFIRPMDGLVDFSGYNRAVIQAVTLDSKIWGVPFTNGNHLMLFYNKRFALSAPGNTDELFRVCDSLKGRGLDYCLAFDMNEPFWLMPWLGAFGGWPIDNKTPALDTPQMRSAINFYKYLRQKKYAPPECDYNCMDSLFRENKAAFIINGDWAISGYQKLLKKDFGMALIPRMSSTGLWPAPMVSGKYFMMSSGVKNEKLELLKRLMVFYTNRANQQRQFKELGRLPALTAASKKLEATGDEVLRVSIAQIEKGRPMSMAPEMRAVWDSARNYLGLALSGKLTVEAAALKMQQNAEQKVMEMNR